MAGGGTKLPSWSGGTATAPAVHGGTRLPSWSGTGTKLPSWSAASSNTPVKTELVGGSKGGGGGLLGAIEGGAHWVASKADLAAHDLKAIPGGLVQTARVEGKVVQEIQAGRPDKAAKTTVKEILVPQARSATTSLAHPLRDPFQTAATIAMLADGAGSVVGRAGAATDAVRAGEGVRGAAKAAGKKPVMPPRLIRSGDGGEQVALQASHRPLPRAFQAVHDKVVQKAIDEKPAGRIAAYGQKRLGGALDEGARVQQRMRTAPAEALDKAAKRLTSKTAKVQGRLHQAALELTSVNTSPEDAARFHMEQASKQDARASELAAKAATEKLTGAEQKELGQVKEAAPRNRVVAKLYQTVADRNLLTKNPDGDVIVNEADHPQLAEADRRLAKVQGRGDEILARYNVRTPEQLQQAANAPGRYRAGATYETPTPGKLGIPSQALLKARSNVERLQAAFDRADERVRKGALSRDQQKILAASKTPTGAEPNSLFEMGGHHEVSPTGMIVTNGHVLAPHGTILRDNIGSRLSAAKDELQRLEQQHVDRQKPVGIIGGETARPARGHVSYASTEKRAPSSPAAASSGPVVGEAKPPITNHVNTGHNIEHGLIPEDVTGQASRHFRGILRFVNTTERRNAAIRTGTSGGRRSARDVLVRIPGAEHAKLTQAVEEALGKAKPTTDDIAGLSAALDEYRHQLVPGLADNFAADNVHPVGTTAEDAAAARGLDAPEGYKWVDKGALGELANAKLGQPGWIARKLNTVNSAVTAATVYFKVGHIGTRVLTNAATNIIQGSADPVSIGKSLTLWHSLSDEDQARALAASGQHSIQALPHEGTGAVARIASRGANWWAKRIDAPFRFNSIAYEARKAGFDTPAKFHDLLDKLENPHNHNMSAAERAKVMGVANRANREAIAYDRLSDFERRYITRAFWFYPWTSAATRFAVNTLLEHPYKSGFLASEGAQGRQAQQARLGDVPSYEYGLIPFGGGKTADFSTFSPLATSADVLGMVARPKEVSGVLNPVYAGLDSLIHGTNQFGAPSKSPIKDALGTVVSPAPEGQMLTGFLNRGKPQGKKMFPADQGWYGLRGPLLRALLGPGLPRQYNPNAGHSAAARERAGR